MKRDKEEAELHFKGSSMTAQLSASALWCSALSLKLADFCFVFVVSEEQELKRNYACYCPCFHLSKGHLGLAGWSHERNKSDCNSEWADKHEGMWVERPIYAHQPQSGTAAVQPHHWNIFSQSMYKIGNYFSWLCHSKKKGWQSKQNAVEKLGALKFSVILWISK